MWATAINSQKTLTDKRIISENMLIGSLINDKGFNNYSIGAESYGIDSMISKEILQRHGTTKTFNNEKIDALTKSKSKVNEIIEETTTNSDFKRALSKSTSKQKSLNKNYRRKDRFDKTQQLIRPTFIHSSDIYGDSDEPDPNVIANDGNIMFQNDNKQDKNNIEKQKSIHNTQSFGKHSQTKKQGPNYINEIILSPAMHPLKPKTKHNSYTLIKKHTNIFGDNDGCEDIYEDNEESLGDNDSSNQQIKDPMDNEQDNDGVINLYNEEDSWDDQNRTMRARNLFYARAKFRLRETMAISSNPMLESIKKYLLKYFKRPPKFNSPLTPEQLNVLGDKGSDSCTGKISYEVPLVTGITNSTSSVRSEQNGKIEVIEHNHSKPDSFIIRSDSYFHLFWDLLCALLILYQILMIPLRISFEINESQHLLNILDFIIDIIFLVDILLNFNTSYQLKGVNIMKRKQIAKNYLKKWFWIDIIASFPYTWFFNFNIVNDDIQPGSLFRKTNLVRVVRMLRFLKVLGLIRVLKLKKIYGRIENIINTSALINTILGFMKITLIILIIAHWIACLWHFIGTYELDQYPDTWLSKIGFTDADWTEKYMASIYWAVTTMLTVGYGDITPATELEMIIVIFIELISSVVFAFSMNSINTLLTNMDWQTTAYRQTLATIHRYMTKRQVNEEVQIKVRKYLEYILDNESSKLDEENLLELLSDNLKHELIADINGKIIANSKIFNEKFSEKFLIELTFIMKSKIFGADEIIFREDDIEDLGIYFIMSGEVEIFSLDSNISLQKLGKSRCFGELGFFSGIKRIASARSKAFSELYCIDRNDFLEKVEHFPEDREIFCMIKDQINLYNDYSDLQIVCYSCSKKGHVSIKCPQIHLELDHRTLISQYIETESKFCKEFVRYRSKIRHKKNSLKLFQKAAKSIQMKHKETFFFIGSYNDIDMSFISNQRSLNTPRKSVDARDSKRRSFLQTYIEVDPKQIDGEIKSQSIRSIKRKKTELGGFTPFQLEKPLATLDMNHTISIDQICQYKFYFPKNNFKIVLFEIMENKKLRQIEAIKIQNFKKAQTNSNPLPDPDKISLIDQDPAKQTVNNDDEEVDNTPFCSLTYSEKKSTMPEQNFNKSLNPDSLKKQNEDKDKDKAIQFKICISELTQDANDGNSPIEQSRSNGTIKGQNRRSSRFNSIKFKSDAIIQKNSLEIRNNNFKEVKRSDNNNGNIQGQSPTKLGSIKNYYYGSNTAIKVIECNNEPDTIEGNIKDSTGSLDKLMNDNNIERSLEKCQPLLSKIISEFGEDFVQNIIKSRETITLTTTVK